MTNALLTMRVQSDGAVTPTLLANLIKYLPDAKEVCVRVCAY